MDIKADTLTDSMIVPGTHWRAGRIEVYRCFKRDLWILADAETGLISPSVYQAWERHWDEAMDHIASLGLTLPSMEPTHEVSVPDLGIDVELWVLIPATEPLERAA